MLLTTCLHVTEYFQMFERKCSLVVSTENYKVSTTSFSYEVTSHSFNRSFRCCVHYKQCYNMNNCACINVVQWYVLCLFIRWIDHLHTTTASLADDGNSAYCKTNGSHNIKYILTYGN